MEKNKLTPRSAMESPVRDIELSSIVLNGFNPHRSISPTEPEELAASISQAGVLQPVCVRETESADSACSPRDNPLKKVSDGRDVLLSVRPHSGGYFYGEPDGGTKVAKSVFRFSRLRIAFR